MLQPYLAIIYVMNSNLFYLTETNNVQIILVSVCCILFKRLRKIIILIQHENLYFVQKTNKPSFYLSLHLAKPYMKDLF